MGEHERCQALDPEPIELSLDVRLWRSLVDEHRPFGHLQQRRVSLADVEERDSQPCRWRELPRR